ncbi:hypothetical protein [Sulfurovum riftiae]|uniref:AsmA-like C-terminal domain-containing protein n=1 Tax=Sulfurovum riftiae TaxID=1630136 RepID=A0A151CGV4_9BACT|nr:hypothetical protein [Sulfurovum riftiae]KYJ86770.1 hypothetical protein AS592_08055 [Sulfurovum riftiae]
MLRLLKRIVLSLVFLELMYVLVLNLALNVGFTQTLINKIKPEKFQITWQKAWTPYPFKFFIEDAAAWGASSSQKWKVAVQTASASVSVLPLLRHRVKVYDIDAVNVDYFQRPVKMDEKKAEKSAYFVPVKHFESTSVSDKKPAEQKKKPKKEKKAWKIDLENIAATGNHSFWIYHAKGDLQGDVNVKRLSIETKSGPFSIEEGRLDVLMNQLQVGKEKEMLSQSKIAGSVTFDPIVFSENKGLKMLSFLSFDIDIRSQMGNLDVLDFYLQRFKTASLKGKGSVEGHINFQRGKLLPATDLQVSADSLSLAMMDYRVEGNGKIVLDVPSQEPETLRAEVLFDSLHASVSNERNATAETELFRGKGVMLEAKGSPQLLPIPSKNEILTYLAVDIPAVIVEDIAVFQRYVPEKWAFKLEKGSGELQANVLLDKTHASLKVQLRSKEATVGLSKQIFKTDLDLLVNFDATTGRTFNASLLGSYLSLKDSILVDEYSKKKRVSQNWDTLLRIDESTFSLPLNGENNVSREGLRSLDRLDVKKLLSTADGTLKVSGTVSQLDWLNLLMKSSLNLGFTGQGQIDADLKLKEGFLAEGSKIGIVPKNLQVGLLDYTFMGEGLFHFIVTKGGRTPSVKFDLALHDARMKRKDEKEAMIEQVKANLQGEIHGFDLKKEQKEIALHLQIPSAKIKNIAVYNSYIPKNSPFMLTSGTADMKTDIFLRSHSAKGYVKLITRGLTMKMDDQKISARLKMDLKISSGVPKDMAFNIAGSTIVLDQARVIGSTTNYRQPDWSAVVLLDKADVVWRKPVRLQSQTSLKIKDSRPVVAMMDNQREKHNWLSKLMTIENIHGKATINMANNVITIPDAYVKSDKIDIGAKGIISPMLRDGMFLLRYKKLKLLLKLKNGKKNIDIFHVQRTFDTYVVPKL